jgi:hypothetical protein
MGGWSTPVRAIARRGLRVRSGAGRSGPPRLVRVASQTVTPSFRALRAITSRWISDVPS